MHEDFAPYYAPLSSARVTITRRRLGADELNQSIRPIRERHGLETERDQYIYTITVDGARAGELRMITLEPRLAFIGWVHVERQHKGRGLGIALHERVLADFGSLAVEDFASADEMWVIAALRDRGHELDERTDVADLRLSRHCKIVDRMYTIRARATAVIS